MTRRLCTICARGGSKGVPGKNVAMVGGKPLIAHSISQAKATGLFEHIAVSSDDAHILQTAKDWGADILIERPAELAIDTAPKTPVLTHALKTVEQRTSTKFDIYMDLDATAPLRLPADIALCVATLEETGCANVLTGVSARRSPYFNLLEIVDGKVGLSKPGHNITRRQDAPRCFDMNASIYGWQRDIFVERPGLFYDDTKLIVMPEMRSVDIDHPLDLKIVTLLMEDGGYQHGDSHVA